MRDGLLTLVGILLAIRLLVWLWRWLGRRYDPRPLLEPRTLSIVITDTADTRFGRLLVPLTGKHPGLSGIVALDDAREAFAARALLIRGAERSIDLQYYIWHPDVSGTLLIDELRLAADRGVRVRLLLDDNGTGGLDATLAALATHANIEVRLFNPFVIRRPKALGYLLDFSRLNRRMHNKSLTADNLLTIIGGRNIGDEYLGASQKDLFADLDVLAIGAIVPDVSADFDRYWACDSSYPAERVLPAPGAGALMDLVAAAKAKRELPLAGHYAQAVRESAIDRLLAGGPEIEWARVVMVSDDPSKGLGDAAHGDLLATRLLAVVGEPKRQLGLVSAYFVPTDAGVAAFAAMAGRGVSIDILTNALKANDVAMVHAGYAPCRVPLLRAGLRLWELKGADPEGRAHLRFRTTALGSAGQRAKRGPVFRSSGSALHAKTFTIDRERMFVGSFNFDPRSLMLNTEMGFVIESPALAGQLQDLFGADVANSAYGVRLAAEGGLEWVEGDVVHRREPGTGPLQRAVMAILSRLPVKWLL